MKKLVLLSALCLLFPISTFGADVEVNSKKIDAQAVISDGRTLVPVRGIFEELGFEVEWVSDTKTATLKSDSDEIIITAGEESFTVNGETITPDVPQQIIDGRFMLPLRAIGESIGADVEWDNETKTAKISMDKNTAMQIKNDGINYIEF